MFEKIHSPSSTPGTRVVPNMRRYWFMHSGTTSFITSGAIRSWSRASYQRQIDNKRKTCVFDLKTDKVGCKVSGTGNLLIGWHPDVGVESIVVAVDKDRVADAEVDEALPPVRYIVARPPDQSNEC